MIELYQFPFSHYCEKVRWALDYKDIAYRTVNLLPGFHFRHVTKLAPKTCVPALRDDGTVVQDSSAFHTSAGRRDLPKLVRWDLLGANSCLSAASLAKRSALNRAVFSRVARLCA